MLCGVPVREACRADRLAVFAASASPWGWSWPGGDFGLTARQLYREREAGEEERDELRRLGV